MPWLAKQARVKDRVGVCGASNSGVRLLQVGGAFGGLSVRWYFAAVLRLVLPIFFPFVLF